MFADLASLRANRQGLESTRGDQRAAGLCLPRVQASRWRMDRSSLPGAEEIRRADRRQIITRRRNNDAIENGGLQMIETNLTCESCGRPSDGRFCDECRARIIEQAAAIHGQKGGRVSSEAKTEAARINA